MELGELDVYCLSRECSRDAWKIYDRLGWQERKLMGDQWMRSIDSIGANIAEGFGRFHYLDKNKFNYNARGSLTEGRHWTELLKERSILSEQESLTLMHKIDRLHLSLNKYIKSTRDLADSKP